MFADYADKWALDNVEFFTESLCGHLYKARHNNADVILKIYKDYGRLEESRGAELLKLWPSEISVRVLENDKDAILLEYLSGDNLKSIVTQGRDEEATKIVASLVKKLHQTPSQSEQIALPDMEEWFEALFKAAHNKSHMHHQKLNKAANIAKQLLSENTSDVMLHGDIHHENVIFDNGGIPKLIDPKGIWGHPEYDVANMMRNPGIDGLVTKARIERQIEIFHDILGFDKQRILKFGFVHSWLSCCWSWMDDQKDMDESIRVAQLFYEMV